MAALFVISELLEQNKKQLDYYYQPLIGYAGRGEDTDNLEGFKVCLRSLLKTDFPDVVENVEMDCPTEDILNSCMVKYPHMQRVFEALLLICDNVIVLELS